MRSFAQMPRAPQRLHAPVEGAMRTRLAITRPGDRHEQEADRTADSVSRMPEPVLARACPCGGGCPRCQARSTGDAQAHVPMNTTATSGIDFADAPSSVQEVLASPGRPLDAVIRLQGAVHHGHRDRVFAPAADETVQAAPDCCGYPHDRLPQ